MEKVKHCQYFPDALYCLDCLVMHFCLNVFSVCFSVVWLVKESNAPFRRVRDDEIEVDPRLADNSFEAKVR